MNIEQAYIVLILNIFIALLIWKFAIQPTLVSIYRDRLEILNIKVRTFALRHNYTKDPAYRNIVDFIEICHRKLDSATWLGLVVYAFGSTRKLALETGINKQIDEEFKSFHKDLQKYISKVRNKITFTMFLHAITTRLGGYIAICITLLCLTCFLTLEMIYFTFFRRAKSFKYSNKLCAERAIKSAIENQIVYARA